MARALHSNLSAVSFPMTHSMHVSASTEPCGYAPDNLGEHRSQGNLCEWQPLKMSGEQPAHLHLAALPSMMCSHLLLSLQHSDSSVTLTRSFLLCFSSITVIKQQLKLHRNSVAKSTDILASVSILFYCFADGIAVLFLVQR